MNVNLKRILSLLLAIILVIGLPISAMAATVDGSTEETEPTTPTEETAPAPLEPTEPLETEATEPAITDPTEETEPTVTEETEPEEETELPATEPAEEAEPTLPDAALSVGEQVENYYPANLLEPDPYAISLMADMNQIPEEMYDNAILRALEYTGYDVQWLKNNGYLYPRRFNCRIYHCFRYSIPPQTPPEEKAQRRPLCEKSVIPF